MDVLYMILAGGKGERLMPLTENTPKPLVRFGSRGAIMDYTLYNCLTSGGGDVLVLTQYHADMMKRYMDVYWRSVFGSSGMKIKVLDSADTAAGTFRGTADAARQGLAAVGSLPEITVVLAGDHVYRMNYQDLVSFHRRHGQAATVGAVPCDPDQARRFGIMNVDRRGCINGFCEKPQFIEDVPGTGSPLASMGIYAFNTRELLEYLGHDPDGLEDFGHHLLPRLVEDGRLRAFPFLDDHGARNYWMDVGDLPSYWKAQMDMLDINNDRLKFRPFPGMGRLPFSRRELIADFDDEHTRIKHSAVADTARIGHAVIEHSVIGPGVTVEEGAVIENSVLLDGVRVRAGTHLRERVVMPMAEVKPESASKATGKPRPLALNCPLIYQKVPAPQPHPSAMVLQ